MIQEKIFETGGLHIAYTEVGPANGRLVFCVHGLLSNGRDYDVLALALAEKGYRVVAMDLPGRGRSEWFADGNLYALPHYIPYCLDFAKHIAKGRPFDWLGASLGGMIGMVLADDIDLNIKRFIIVDIGAEVPGPALDKIAALAHRSTIYEKKSDAIAFLKTRCAGWGIRSDEHWDHLIAHNIVDLPEGKWRMHYDPAIGINLPAKNETVSLWGAWESIKQPVLLIRGGTSKILPHSVAEAMVDRHQGKGVELLTFAECGHVPNLMEEERIEKIIAWLS